MLAVNWSATCRPRRRRDQHVAARNLDLVVEHQRDRLPLDGAAKIAAMRDDALHPRRLAGLGHHDLVTRRNRAGGDRAGKAAEIEVRAVHILHREAERAFRHGVVNHDRFEMLEQRRAGIPADLLGTVR